MWLNITQFKFNTSGIFSRNKSVQREITSPSDGPIGEKRAELAGLAAPNRKGAFVLAKGPLLYAAPRLKRRKQELCHK